MDHQNHVLKQAWTHYQQAVDAARQSIESRPRFTQPELQAQGYRCLLEAQAMAYNWAIAPQTRHPRIYSHTIWSTDQFTLAGNCTDFIYSAAFLDGRRRYRLSGRFGDVRLILLQVFSGSMGAEGARCTSNHELRQPPAGVDDRVEILLSADRQPGHWIALDRMQKYNTVMIRRLMADWFDDRGELVLEVLGAPPVDDVPSDVAFAERLGMAAGFVRMAVDDWSIGLIDRFAARAGRSNAWVNIAGEQMAAMGGSQTCNYAFLVWEMQPDEAIILEMDVPRNSSFWSFQVYDLWCKSFDFMHAQTDVNMHRAWVDDDQRVRIVISIEDPGVSNWMDPMGRIEGFCAMRNYLAETLPEPSLRKVKFTGLREHLPRGTPTFTPEQRHEALDRRRRGLARLYDL